MLATLVAAIVAASPSPSPSPTAVPEIAHVVTSDRGRESATRTARTTYVVTAAQIARDGDRTVADALEDVPGVNVVRYGAFGAATSVGIRGSSSQQVLVLVDGLPMAGGQIDDVNLEQFPVSGIDRIEVVEGGGSTLYGSGSIGGVINIITAAQPERSTATISTGSFDEAELYLSNAVSLVPADLRHQRLFGRKRAEPAERAGGTDWRDGAIFASDRRIRRHACSGNVADALIRRARASLDIFRRRASKATSTATSAEPRAYGRAIRDVAASSAIRPRPLLHVQHARRYELSELDLSHAVATDDHESAVRADCSTISIGWRACATSSARSANGSSTAST